MRPAGSVPLAIEKVDRADAAGLREGLAERRAGRAGGPAGLVTVMVWQLMTSV